MKRILVLLLCSVPALALSRLPGDYHNDVGGWFGNAEYRVSFSGRVDPLSVSVTPLNLTIQPGGRIEGDSLGNGCHLVGITNPVVAGQLYNLDVTVTGCRYAGLNRRYFGTLFLNESQLYANFSLRGSYTFNPGAGYAEIKVKLSH